MTEPEDIPELPPSLQLPTDLFTSPNRHLGSAQSPITEDANGINNNPTAKKEKEKPPRKRREIVKLDADKLLSSNGLPRLRHLTSKFAPTIKGKGHETEDLTRLLTLYQIWAHTLYPKLKFRDVIEKTEKVCRERRLKVFLEAVLGEERRRRFGWDEGAAEGGSETGEANENENDDSLGLEHDDPTHMQIDNTLPGHNPFAPAQSQIAATKQRALAKLAERQREKRGLEERQEKETEGEGGSNDLFNDPLGIFDDW